MVTITKKKLRLKSPIISFFKVIGFIIIVIIGLFVFYRYQISPLKKYNYSEEACKNILFSFKKDDVLNVGENKTLNAAFESDDYKEKNFKNYTRIDYQNHKHLIKNINKLIKIGYTDGEISTILSHGSDNDVSEFTKRNRVRYIDEFYSLDFAKLKLYDRYINYSNETGEDEETTVIYVNLDMDKEEYTTASEVKNFSTTMLVNKHFKLSEKFEPDNLVKIDKKYASEEDMKLNREAYNAFLNMNNDAVKAGMGLVINSAYRSYSNQQELTDLYLNSYGQNYVDKYVAKPGFSEHQTGLCFDIGSTSSNVFAKSKEYIWMLDNSYKYGYILRFRPDIEDITGFRSESWHYRYVGKTVAKKIHESNMSFEEYYARYLDK